MEALPPTPPAEVAYYEEEIPDISDPITIDPGDLAQPEASIELADDDSVEASKFARLRASKFGKVALGEGVGTIVDMVTIGAGVPLPLREVGGSGLDSVVYGNTGEKQEVQTRLQRVGRRIGKVAVFAVAGMAAQKFGTETANLVYDRLNDGAMGEYVTPLVSKGAAIGAIGKFAPKL